MATITLSVQIIPGLNNTQLLQKALDRVLNQVVAMTKNYEAGQTPVADIPLT